MGIPLLAGRDAAESDTQDTLSVAVVSESFARNSGRRKTLSGAVLTLRFTIAASWESWATSASAAWSAIVNRRFICPTSRFRTIG